MTVSARTVTVLDEATRLDTAANGNAFGRQSIVVKVATAGTVWCGGPDVDTDDGFPLEAGVWTFDLIEGEGLFAISEGSVDVNVLETGVL